MGAREVDVFLVFLRLFLRQPAPLRGFSCYTYMPHVREVKMLEAKIPHVARAHAG